MTTPPPAAPAPPATPAPESLPWTDACTQILAAKGYTDPKRLGEGGYSVVYKFYSSKTGDRKEVAIKYIDMDKIRDKSYIQKYMPRELEALMSLQHPNICKILEGVTDSALHADGFPHRYWIVMELCKTDLFEIAAQCPKYQIPEKHARIFIKQVASALKYMKEKGWAHRDIKTENILIRSADSAALTDFSFVRIQQEHTLSTTAIGTPPYSAPEVLKCMLKQIDAYDAFPADVWSLAATTFFATAGAGFVPNAVDSAKDILPTLSEVPKKITDNEVISDPLKDLLHKMTDVIPAKRLTIEQVCDHHWFTLPEKDLKQASKLNPDAPSLNPSRQRSMKAPTPAQPAAAAQVTAAPVTPKTSPTPGHQPATNVTAPVAIAAHPKKTKSPPAPAIPATPATTPATPKSSAPTAPAVAHKSPAAPQPGAPTEVKHHTKTKSPPAAAPSDTSGVKVVPATIVPLVKLEKKKSPENLQKITETKAAKSPSAPSRRSSKEDAKGPKDGKDGKKAKSSEHKQ